MRKKKNWNRCVKRWVEQIARNEGVGENVVMDAMQEALLAGYSNPDPAVQERWKQIPASGEMPTPEEFIVWAALKVLSEERWP